MNRHEFVHNFCQFPGYLGKNVELSSHIQCLARLHVDHSADWPGSTLLWSFPLITSVGKVNKLILES